jgi:hypothetical protein
MHKSATKCNETIGKWCKNKHGASKIIDTLEMYHRPEIGRVQKLFPATCQRGESPLEVFFIAMLASGMMSE